ncbi:MAG: 6-phosphogluconolactonase [Chloroflexota bacterium]
MKSRVIVASSKQMWINRAVDLIVESANQAIRERGRFSLVLSGGSTPQPVYQALALPHNLKRIILSRTHIFFGDERCVSPGDPQSNYRMVKLALLENAPIPAANIHRMRGELRPPAAAADYQKQIEEYFEGQEQRFDLVLLGLGTDGHTASLFPGTKALEEKHAWVAANQLEAPLQSNHVPAQQAWRITLTYPALSTARRMVFLVRGEGKQEIIGKIFDPEGYDPQIPAAKIAENHPDQTWVLDKSAGRKLTI